MRLAGRPEKETKDFANGITTSADYIPRASHEQTAFSIGLAHAHALGTTAGSVFASELN